MKCRRYFSVYEHFPIRKLSILVIINDSCKQCYQGRNSLLLFANTRSRYEQRQGYVER